MKKFMAVVGLLVMAGLSAFALTASNYWIYWVSGDTVIAGITASGRLDTLAGATFGGNISLSGTLTVGEDDTGYDVKFYGATSGKYWLWDESADGVVLKGSFSQTGNMSIVGTLTVGVDDTGHDVTFYGATSGKKFFWDESADTAFLTCTVDIDGTVTVGEDDTGYDVTLYGATAGAAVQWDESDDQLELVGSANISHASATNAGPVFVSVNTVDYTQTTSKTLCVVPANADIVDVMVVINTAFDDSGTDLLNVGWSADPDALVDDHNVASAGVARMGSGATMPYANIGDVGSSDLTITGSYTGQNGDASAGSATIYIYWTTGTPGS